MNLQDFLIRAGITALQAYQRGRHARFYEGTTRLDPPLEVDISTPPPAEHPTSASTPSSPTRPSTCSLPARKRTSPPTSTARLDAQ